MVQINCSAWARCETVNALGLRPQEQQARVHYFVLIIVFTVDNFVMGLTLKPVEARPNRKAENGSGVIGKWVASQRVLSKRSRGAMQALHVSSPSGVRGSGSGAEPRKIRIFQHFWTSKITSEQTNSLSDNFLFDAAPSLQYVLNDSADNKLNGMDSVLRNVVMIM